MLGGGGGEIEARQRHHIDSESDSIEVRGVGDAA